jgi:hypothetical protein
VNVWIPPGSALARGRSPFHSIMGTPKGVMD